MSVIFRYLAREVLLAMLTIALVVLVIAIGWRFSGYLGDAADGLLMREVLFQVMLYRTPGLLELIIPLSFFLGIVVAYGRLYVDSEMTVLAACGISDRQLLRTTLAISALVMVLAAVTSLWLKSAGEARLARVLNDQRNITEFDTLASGRFQTVRSGRRVTYTESLDRQTGDLGNIFVAERRPGHETSWPANEYLITARQGSQLVDPASGNRFLVLKDGFRTAGEPGRADYQIVRYREYGQLVARENNRNPRIRTQTLSTPGLFGNPATDMQAELQWRLSMVLMVPLVALIALPLSRVQPRQGRYARLLPGIFICFVYVILLSSARAAVEKGQIPAGIGLWWVHGLMLLVAALHYLPRRPIRAMRRPHP